MQPEIWVEKMNAEYQVMAGSPRPTNEVTSISTKEDIGITTVVQAMVRPGQVKANSGMMRATIPHGISCELLPETSRHSLQARLEAVLFFSASGLQHPKTASLTLCFTPFFAENSICVMYDEHFQIYHSFDKMFLFHFFNVDKRCKIYKYYNFARVFSTNTYELSLFSIRRPHGHRHLCSGAGGD